VVIPSHFLAQQDPAPPKHGLEKADGQGQANQEHQLVQRRKLDPRQRAHVLKGGKDQLQHNAQAQPAGADAQVG
jgi:hypothetical protein